MVADGAGGDDGQAVFVELLRIELDVVGDDDDLGVAALVGVQTERPRSAGDHQADIAVLDAVFGQGVIHRLGQCLLCHRNRQPNRLGRVPKPIQMGLEPKNFAAVAPHPLKNPVAVQESVVVDADFGVLFVVELAGDIDLQGHGRKSE